MRQLGIRIKLNPLREAIRGLRLVVVDDSIVRGNTTKAIVAMLREAGAREVHVRITSPPVRWPCFYGIDMPTRAELVASDLLTGRGGQLRRRRLARLPVAGGPDRDRGRPGRGPEASARRASRGATRSRWRPRSRARSCSRAWRPPSARWTAEPLTYAQAGVDVEAGGPGGRADAGRRSRRPTAPRCWAASAGSPGCGGSPGPAAGPASPPTRCWPRPATGSAPSCWSPRPSTATTPSASTWSPWWSTTWS